MEEKDKIKVDTNVESIKVETKPQDNKSLAVTNNKLTDTNNNTTIVDDIIFKTAQESKQVKDVIDLAATSKALQDEKTVNKIVSEKTEELQRDAEAKKIKAETDKIKEEVEKVKQEMEKEIAELEKQKKTLEGEVDKLKALDDKATAYFNANKSILKCIGVREKLSLKAMQWLMVPAGIVFAIFQIILLPFSLLGFGIEQIMNIVETVCGKIAKGGWKVVLSILVTVLILALVGFIYYAVVNWAGNIFG